jgi:hypothetical protein
MHEFHEFQINKIYMRGNFILQFAEQPKDGAIDSGLVEYSERLNLNVIKGSEIPAVMFAEDATETFTKADTEGSDSDHDRYQRVDNLSDTETNTFHATEGSDSDRGVKGLFALLDTETITEAVEATDSDKK